MRLIYHDERKSLTYEQVYEGCQKGYGIKQPDRISGFNGFFYRLPDIYVYGMLETWLEHNEKMEDELKSFINRFKAEDYGFVTRNEHDGNTEDRWLCGSYKWNIGRYSFGKDYNHLGGVVLEFFDDFGLMYSIEEDMRGIYGKYYNDPAHENQIQHVSFWDIKRRSEERRTQQRAIVM